eukprot:TRINITY_DN3895_c0_g1_i1.p1 TRINITY_DN3895_c0_g1~~TRINITY_DN3895_c0_g1_i1.p1  ORF type:complete len:437 (+),score=79.25 TRINITY_DN3895_c0_g1_i1:78-1388(+)
MGKNKKKEKVVKGPAFTPPKRDKPFHGTTGPHLDINPYCMWKKQMVQFPKSESDYVPLDRWRPFQAQIPLRDQVQNDGSLEVIPGSHLFIERYYQLMPPGVGTSIPLRSYNCGLEEESADILPFFAYVKRIPEDWDAKKLTTLPTTEQIQAMSRQEVAKWLSVLYKEIRSFEKSADYPRTGDYIIWDMRLPHQTGVHNRSNQVRQTLYHALIPSVSCNVDITQKQRNNRDVGLHPPDFPKLYVDLEQSDGYTPFDLNQLGTYLYGYESWPSGQDLGHLTEGSDFKLTQQQIDFFQRYGYVVIPNCIPQQLIDGLQEDITNFLGRRGIDVNDLENSDKRNWNKVCGIFGAMLEYYYAPHHEAIRQHPNTYLATSQLLKNTWASTNKKELGFWHPFEEELNPEKLWIYIDRMNYRVPERIGDIIKQRYLESMGNNPSE